MSVLALVVMTSSFRSLLFLWQRRTSLVWMNVSLVLRLVILEKTSSFESALPLALLLLNGRGCLTKLVHQVRKRFFFWGIGRVLFLSNDMIRMVQISIWVLFIVTDVLLLLLQVDVFESKQVWSRIAWLPSFVFFKSSYAFIFYWFVLRWVFTLQVNILQLGIIFESLHFIFYHINIRLNTPTITLT